MNRHYDFEQVVPGTLGVAKSGTFSIVAIVGGSAVGILPHLQKHPPNYTLIVDVMRELEGIRPDYDRLKHREALSLADRETTDTLLAEIYDTDRAIHGRVGAAVGTDGMGQRRVFGQIAAGLLIKSPQFKELCDRLRDEVLVQTNGAPDRITLTVCGSCCGGTAAGAAEQLAIALVAALEPLRVPIAVAFNILDSVSFATVGPNIHANAAAATQSLLHLVGAKGGKLGSKVCWSLRLCSLPPVRGNKRLRSSYVGLDYQAFQCGALQTHLQMVDPNHALRHRYGNVSLVSSDFHYTIPEATVSAAVATEFYYRVRAAVQTVTPSKDLIERLLENRSSYSLQRKELEAILNDAFQMSSEEMVHAVRRPGELWIFAPAILTASGEEYSLTNIADHFVAVPASLTEAVRNIILLHSIQSVLAHEDAILSDEITELEALAERQERRCRKLFDKLRRKSLFRSAAATFQRAFEASEDLRNLSDDLRLAKAVREELRMCQERVTAQIHSQRERLDRVLSILDRHRTKGSTGATHPLFIVQSVDSAFSDLLVLPELDAGRQRRLLAAQVERVTIDGLACIVRAATTNVETIAQKLVGDAVAPGGFVGGERPPVGEVFYVLPPVADALAREIEQHVSYLSPTALVFVGDSCASGLNVVRFKVNRPQSRAQAMPGLLKTELKKAKSPPYSEIYAIDPAHWKRWMNGDAR